jgi:hypothetical protein
MNTLERPRHAIQHGVGACPPNLTALEPPLLQFLPRQELISSITPQNLKEINTNQTFGQIMFSKIT